MKTKLLITAVSFLSVIACSGGAKITQGNDASASVFQPNNLTTASAQISAASGGYINVGSAQLRIPAQALYSDTTITAEIADISLPAGSAQAVGKGVRLKPEGLQFLNPAELEICYSGAEAASLNESNAQIYYHTEDNQYVAIAGTVDVNRHCVKSHIEHFSSYVAAAVAQVPGNTAPVIGGANFLPTTPMAGIPLRVRTAITDVNGGAVPGQVVSAFLYYRIVGAPSFTKVALQPDDTDDTVTNRYYYQIPASAVTLAGIEYYFEATDNLNLLRRLPAAAGTFSTRTVPTTATALRFNPVGDLQISAGFMRALTLQAFDGTAWQNISADNSALTNPAQGSLLRTGPSTVRFSAVGAGAGQITSTIASLTTATNINVVPGLLTHIEITDVNQVILTGTANLPAGQVYNFDVIGFDTYGNVATILPLITTTGSIGTISTDLTGAHLAAASSAGSGSIVADIAGFTDTLNVNIYMPPQVTATAPFDNTSGIALNASVGVSFSHVMDTSTLTTTTTSACTGSLQVSSDNFVTCVAMASATPGFYASNTLAVIQPAVDLAGSTTYKIRVTTAARDTAGNPLVAVYTTPTGFTTVVVPPTTLLGDALWARTTAPGTTDITSFSGAAADNSGVYVVSTLNAGTYNFGPGVSVTISSWACGVIVKYDHAGVAQWAKVPIATQRSTSFAKVVSDNAGSVYVVGYQAGSGTNDFGGGVSVTTTGLHPNALLLKYDSNGNAIWGRTINPGSPYDVQSGYGAAHVSADGSVYVGGYYSSPFPPIGATLSPTVSLPAVSGSRTLVVKYDADGNALWVRPAETGNSNYVSGIGSITTDGLGGVYAAGSQGGNSIISYGAGITITTDNGGTSSSLLLKYDTEGNILWARVAVPPALSSNASSTFTSVKTDSAGNVYLTGTQRGLLSFNYGNGVSGTAPYFANNAVLVKYDSNGSAQWLRTASVAPLNSFFMDLVIPSDTEIYAVGYQQNNGNYSYGNALNVAGPSATAFNAVFLRFNEQGNLLAAKTLVSAPDHSVYYSIAFTGSAFYLVGSQTYGGLYDFGNAVTTLGGYVAGGNGLIVKYQR